MARYLGQRFGDYHLVGLLGEGSFAEVYEADHLYLLGTKAAIKILKDAFTQKQIEELRKEALIVNTLDHPYIVRLLGFSVERNIPYLIMSYAPGGALDKRHPRNMQLPLPTIVSYVRQAADALQAAHTRRIIHRDIKPANLLLTQDGRVQVGDFGIALMAQNSTSWTQQEIVGTWLYMAPEQFEGQAGPASDQYSLGLVVYQWLCGNPPFTGQGNIHALPYQQMHTPPPALWKRVPNLSLAIEQVVMKALAKKPEERWPSVQAFAVALEQASKKPAPGTTLLTYEHQRCCIRTIGWSPDGKHLASGGDDSTVCIWDASTGETRLTLRGHSDCVEAVAWSPDGKWLASAFSVDETVQVWEASRGKRLLRYTGHSHEVRAVAWSPDGERIASADYEVHIWQAR